MTRDEVFEAQRTQLFGLAYRMLGSVMDAEDVLQEAYLRWHAATAGAGGDPVRSPRTYLWTIVTRLCIDHLRAERARRESYVGVWLPEPLVDRDTPDPGSAAELAESLSVAFLLLLERLRPLERAVFLLRQVFAYEYAEIAVVVGRSEAYCRQIMRRARQHLAAQRLRSPVSAERQARLTDQFLRTCMSGDMEGLVTLLADDIVLAADGGGKRPAPPAPLHGPVTVARFLIGSLRSVPAGFRVRMALVNGGVGLVSYVDRVVDAVLSLDMMGDRIQGIYIVRNPDKLHAVPPAA